MDCERMNEALVPFYFGVTTDDERGEIGEHLVGCTRCLRAYLALKQHAEAGANEEPSAALGARIRADVARALRPSPLARARKIVGVRVPVYQVALAAAVLALTLGALGLRARPRAVPIETRIDLASAARTEM